MIPSLIPYAEPIDGGESWIAYKHRELGGTFVNGREELPEYGPSFTSQELHMCPGSLISDMSKLKAEFPGSKVVSGSISTAFDDLATHPDDIPVKSDTPVKAAEKRKTKAVVEAMKKFSERA
tara:strand:- start:116 stop:481 length:366 start_codon:yes stop_codon:yes gene_type:complete